VTAFYRESHFFKAEFPWVDEGMFLLELAMSVYIFIISLKFKRYLVTALILVQTLIMAGIEVFFKAGVVASNNFFIDKLSVIMVFIIGIIGSLICIYGVGYMKDFHEVHRKEVSDKRRLFFFLMFAFLSAMFGIVFSNNLLWLFFFWEVTTLCSFMLIGYKGTEESVNNAFRALLFNLLGGLAFAGALVYMYKSLQIIELDKLLIAGKGGILLPIILISFAGLTKSAQMPFSSWLVGAMVAPTPVSALLHSSTMVKAGVYIIMRFAAVLSGTLAGLTLGFIGVFTFLIASFIAISATDSKKVLAYSTIANLGLIVLCAGIGTYEALWAAALLLIFHAVAKSLLFMCVGVVGRKLHSRNIEDMSGLIISLPRISIMLQIGMAGMFLAPFGMLISKWAVLRALVDFNPLLAVFVVFGSAATLFFWVKWMGKLITVINEKEYIEDGLGRSEWIPLYIISGLTIGLCGFFPLVSSWFIEPYVIDICGKTMTMTHGNIIIMSSMLAMVMLFPLSFINYGKKVKVVDAYLGGANVSSATEFLGSAGAVQNMEMKNYYLEKYFGEKVLYKIAIPVSIILLIIMFGCLYI